MSQVSPSEKAREPSSQTDATVKEPSTAEKDTTTAEKKALSSSVEQVEKEGDKKKSSKEEKAPSLTAASETTAEKDGKKKTEDAKGEGGTSLETPSEEQKVAGKETQQHPDGDSAQPETSKQPDAPAQAQPPDSAAPVANVAADNKGDGEEEKKNENKNPTEDPSPSKAEKRDSTGEPAEATSKEEAAAETKKDLQKAEGSKQEETTTTAGDAPDGSASLERDQKAEKATDSDANPQGKQPDPENPNKTADAELSADARVSTAEENPQTESKSAQPPSDKEQQLDGTNSSKTGGDTASGGDPKEASAGGKEEPAEATKGEEGEKKEKEEEPEKTSDKAPDGAQSGKKDDQQQELASKGQGVGEEGGKEKEKEAPPQPKEGAAEEADKNKSSAEQPSKEEPLAHNPDSDPPPPKETATENSVAVPEKEGGQQKVGSAPWALSDPAASETGKPQLQTGSTDGASKDEDASAKESQPAAHVGGAEKVAAQDPVLQQPEAETKAADKQDGKGSSESLDKPAEKEKEGQAPKVEESKAAESKAEAKQPSQELGENKESSNAKEGEKASNPDEASREPTAQPAPAALGGDHDTGLKATKDAAPESGGEKSGPKPSSEGPAKETDGAKGQEAPKDDSPSPLKAADSVKAEQAPSGQPDAGKAEDASAHSSTSSKPKPGESQQLDGKLEKVSAAAEGQEQKKEGAPEHGKKESTPSALSQPKADSTNGPMSQEYGEGKAQGAADTSPKASIPPQPTRLSLSARKGEKQAQAPAPSPAPAPHDKSAGSPNSAKGYAMSNLESPLNGKRKHSALNDSPLAKEEKAAEQRPPKRKSMLGLKAIEDQQEKAKNRVQFANSVKDSTLGDGKRPRDSSPGTESQQAPKARKVIQRAIKRRVVSSSTFQRAQQLENWGVWRKLLSIQEYLKLISYMEQEKLWDRFVNCEIVESNEVKKSNSGNGTNSYQREEIDLDHLRLRVRALLMDNLIEFSCGQKSMGKSTPFSFHSPAFSHAMDKPNLDSVYNSLEYDAEIISIFTEDLSKPSAVAPQSKQKGVRELSALLPDEKPPKSATKPSKANSETKTVTTLPQLKMELERIIEDLLSQDISEPFSEPVKKSIAPDYYTIIKRPMDFGTMRKGIAKNKYPNPKVFEADLDLILSNCETYNEPNCSLVEWGRRLVQRGKDLVKQIEWHPIEKPPAEKPPERGLQESISAGAYDAKIERIKKEQLGEETDSLTEEWIYHTHHLRSMRLKEIVPDFLQPFAERKAKMRFSKDMKDFFDMDAKAFSKTFGPMGSKQKQNIIRSNDWTQASKTASSSKPLDSSRLQSLPWMQQLRMQDFFYPEWMFSGNCVPRPHVVSKGFHPKSAAVRQKSTKEASNILLKFKRSIDSEFVGLSKVKQLFSRASDHARTMGLSFSPSRCVHPMGIPVQSQAHRPLPKEGETLQDIARSNRASNSHKSFITKIEGSGALFSTSADSKKCISKLEHFVIARIAGVVGFDTIRKSSLDILADLLERVIARLGAAVHSTKDIYSVGKSPLELGMVVMNAISSLDIVRADDIDIWNPTPKVLAALQRSQGEFSHLTSDSLEKMVKESERCIDKNLLTMAIEEKAGAKPKKSSTIPPGMPVPSYFHGSKG